MADLKRQARQPEPQTPPNGGTRAWLQVLGGFLVFFNTWYGLLRLLSLTCHTDGVT